VVYIMCLIVLEHYEWRSLFMWCIYLMSLTYVFRLRHYFY